MKTGANIAAFRIWKASLLGSASAFIPVIILAAYVYFTWDARGASPDDDAPLRSMALMMVFSPAIYLAMTAASVAASFTLKRLYLLSSRSLFFLQLSASILAGILCGIRSPFGIVDQLIGVTVFFVFFTCCGLCWLLSWWMLCFRPSANIK